MALAARLSKTEEDELPAVPLAMILSVLFEKTDDIKLVQAANDVISKRGLFDINKGGKIVSGNYSVKGVKLDQPILVQSLKKRIIEGKNVRINFELNKIKLRSLGKFTTRKEDTLLKMNIEDVMLTTHFALNGEVEGIVVDSSGIAGIILENVSTEISVEHSVDDVTGETQILNVTMNVKFRTAEFVEPREENRGLKQIERVDIRRLMNTATKIYLRRNLTALSESLAGAIKDRLNKALKNKGRNQMIAMLTKASTS